MIYGLWLLNRQEINRLELFWLESLEILETMVPGPGFRRGATENGRRFAAIKSECAQKSKIFKISRQQPKINSAHILRLGRP